MRFSRPIYGTLPDLNMHFQPLKVRLAHLGAARGSKRAKYLNNKVWVETLGEQGWTVLSSDKLQTRLLRLAEAFASVLYR